MVRSPAAATHTALCWLWPAGPGWLADNPSLLSRVRRLLLLLLLPVQIVMKDRVTQKPRGFGFVTFKEQEAADRAFQEEHVLDGRTVRMQEGGRSKGRGPSTRAQHSSSSSASAAADRKGCPGVSGRPGSIDCTQQSCWLKLQASAVAAAAAAAQPGRLPTVTNDAVLCAAADTACM